MLRRLVLALALVAAITSGRPGSAAQPPAVGLLVDPGPGAAAPLLAAPGQPDTLQQRATVVNLTAFDADVMDIALFAGGSVRAEIDRRGLNPDGSSFWSGQVADEPLSAVTFVRAGDIVQGSIRSQSGAYSIEPLAGTALHTLRQVDLTQLGAELPPLVPVLPKDAGDAPSIAEDDGTVFDVLVVYTAAARTVAGGDAAVQARINLGINETNTAYANSGIVPRLRLVGAELITYTEHPDMSVDLGALTNTSDGQMDSVHARRNALGADLVTLVVDSADPGACGIAWLMTTLSAGFATNAFSVTDYGCISPNYTFGHELGHNMGSNHAPNDPVTSTPLYPYSFGYKNPSNLFRTVMAYNCGGGGCPRVLYFSNPSVNYNGAPTGTLAQNHNALSINNARTTIANWRQAVDGNTPPTISTIASQIINEDGITASLGFTVGDAQTPASSLSVSAVSSNATLVPNTGAALAFGGSGASRTLTVTPAANQNGTATITVSVSDGALTSSAAFLLTVNAVNDAPGVTRNPTSASVANGVAAQTTVTVTDVDTAGTSLALSATSSHLALLPNANIGIAVTATSANSRTYQVTMTPVAGQQGVATVTLTGSDGPLSGSQPFTLTVAPTSAPVVSAIGTQVTGEDTPTAPIAFTVSDPDTPVDSLTASALSTNTALVPNSGAALAFGGAGSNRTLTVTPEPDQSGSTTITVSVSDGAYTTSRSFVLTVNAVNDPPSINGVASQTTSEDTPLTVSFTVSDIDSPVGGLTVAGASGNSALVGPGGMVPGGIGASRTMTLTPEPDQHGTATITVTVGDGAATAQTSFSFTVTPVNDAPVFASVPPLVSTTTGAPTTFSVTVNDVDSAGESLSLSGTSSNPTLLPQSGITIAAQSSTGSSRTFSVTLEPAAGETGSANLQLTASDPAASAAAQVAVTVSTVATAPDAPTASSASAVATTVTIGWVPALTGWAPTSFVVEIGTSPGTTTLPTQTVADAVTSLQVTLPAGTYFTRVRAVNAVGSSAPSPEASVTVVEPSPIPGPPANFVAGTLGRTVSFSWTPATIGAPATTYVIEAGSGPGLSNLATLDTGGTGTSLSVPNVPPGTYWVRVRGANGAGLGAPSQDVSLVMGVTGGCVGLPGLPVLLTPVVSGNNVSLTWSAPTVGGTPTSYVLAAGTTAGLSNLALFSTGSTGTSFAASAADGLYYVRVAASNGCGIGPASNEVSFTLGEQRPDAPSNLAWSAGAGIVTLAWGAPLTGAAPTSYLLEAGSASGLANLAVISTGSAATSFAASAPPGSYFVRVRAVNGAGAGVASNEVVVVVP